MADISVTAASVLGIQSGTSKPARKIAVTFGATIVAGKAVCKNPSTGKWELADANVTPIQSGSEGLGIAACGGGDGQPGFVWVDGDVDFGSGLTAGETYQVSANAGNIAPVGDISTNYPATLGLAISARYLRLKPLVAGVAHG